MQSGFIANKIYLINREDKLGKIIVRKSVEKNILILKLLCCMYIMIENLSNSMTANNYFINNNLDIPDMYND